MFKLNLSACSDYFQWNENSFSFQKFDFKLSYNQSHNFKTEKLDSLIKK